MHSKISFSLFLSLSPARLVEFQYVNNEAEIIMFFVESRFIFILF